MRFGSGHAMLRRLLLFGAALATMSLLGAGAQAERRVALVIGNSAYNSTAALRNPRNDASDMAEALKTFGFEVTLGLDLDQGQFAGAINKFARTLDGADVALFFYAGHGLQINEKNYLVSVNAQLSNEFLIPSETIELDSIVGLMWRDGNAGFNGAAEKRAGGGVIEDPGAPLRVAVTHATQAEPRHGHASAAQQRIFHHPSP